MLKRTIALLTFCVFILTTTMVLAHPGRLDANGGHWNHKTKTYHYHKNGKIQVDESKSRKYNKEFGKKKRNPNSKLNKGKKKRKDEKLNKSGKKRRDKKLNKGKKKKSKQKKGKRNKKRKKNSKKKEEKIE